MFTWLQSPWAFLLCLISSGAEQALLRPPLQGSQDGQLPLSGRLQGEGCYVLGPPNLPS